MDPSKTSILIAGANGTFGSRVTKHCLAYPNLQVNILVRDINKNKEIVDSIVKAGGKVFEGDLVKNETIKDVTKGMHTVVSCIMTKDLKLFTLSQENLLKDSIENGVKRFVPSEYGLLHSKVPEGENIIMDSKKKFRRVLEKSGINHLYVANSLWMEWFPYFAAGFTYWGEIPTVKFSLTAMDDAAKFTAAAIAVPNRTGDLVVAGDHLTMMEAAATYNKVRGTSVQPIRKGSLEDLKKEMEVDLAGDDKLRGMYSGIYRIFTDGRGLLTNNDNSEFPQVKPQTFKEFLISHPDYDI